MKKTVFSFPLLLCASVFVLSALSGKSYGKEIIIAQVAAFTGPQAAVGKGLEAGINLYFDAINQSGGVNGNTLKLISKDDGYDAQKTAALAQELITQHAPLALIGVQGTANNEALQKAEVLKKNGILLIGPRSGAASLRNDPNIFHVRASYADEADKIINHLVRGGQKKIGVFYQNDGLGKDGLAAINQRLNSYQIQTVLAVPYERNTTKIEESVRSFLAAQIDAIVIVGVQSVVAPFVQAYRGAHGAAQLFAFSLLDPALILKSLGPALAHGLAFTQVLPDPNARVSTLVQEIRKNSITFKPNLTIDINVVEGYVMAKVLTQALKRAGNNPTRENLVRALETMPEFDLGGYTISYGAGKRTSAAYVEMAIIGRNGKLVY